MTTAGEHALAASLHAHNARNDERDASESVSAYALVYDAQSARLRWVWALVSLLRFVNALPEPVAIPPVPQPSEEAKRRGLYIGARVVCDGHRGEIIAWDCEGDPIVDCGPDLILDAWSATAVTLAGDAS